MLNFKSMRKSKLALALSTAVMAGALTTPSAQAVQLAQDGLGDAIIFPYFTAKSNWQTFVRLINTSQNAVVVKVRFREAANSRELRDFLVALSPNDMWSAWTDAAALNGQPGIRTNDTSCIFDLPNSGPSTFQTIDGHLKGLAFSSAAFTGQYSDSSPATTAARLGEGYIEVIGVASYPPATDIARAITHTGNGVPNNCSEAMDLFRNTAVAPGQDVGNVIAANAQILNVPNGEGIGYDPVVLSNFQNQSLKQETLFRLVNANGAGHGQWPTLDSADPNSVILTDDGRVYTSLWDAAQTGNYLPDGLAATSSVAAQQFLADGTVALITTNQADLNNDGDTNDIIPQVQNADGSILATDVPENNVPAAVVAALTGRQLNNTLSVGNVRIVSASFNPRYAFSVVQNTRSATATNPARRTNIPHEVGTLGNAVRGGIDAVSAVLMRNSVINEWAASPNPAGIVKDFYTQWVLTFPTKHYYVDLQDDPVAADRFAPTLVDPRGDAGTDLNDAFAPFSKEFNWNGGTATTTAGTSCEPYQMDLWDREESKLGFTSPAGAPTTRICNEVNVLSFTTAYATKGFNSNFGAVVPDDLLPPNAMLSPFTRAQRGWGRLTFTGDGAATGLLATSTFSPTPFALNPNSPAPFADALRFPGMVRYRGLPVIGFGVSNYGTGSVTTNHNAANAHKYEKVIVDPPNVVAPDVLPAVPAPGTIIN